MAYAVSVAARVQDNPTQAHMKLVKRIMRYLKGTLNYCISYHPCQIKLMLRAYSDADHAGDKETRKSTSDFLMQLSDGPIMWRSRLQRCVSLSSMEAEFILASEA